MVFLNQWQSENRIAPLCPKHLGVLAPTLHWNEVVVVLVGRLLQRTPMAARQEVVAVVVLLQRTAMAMATRREVVAVVVLLEV